MVMSLATFVTTQADLWVAGVFLAKSDVAVYGAAVRLVQLVLVPLLVVNAVVAPMIAGLYARRATRELEGLLGASATVSALPGVVVLAVLAVFAQPILSLLYGEPYGRAAACLVLVSLGQLVNAFCGPAATVLMMSGRERAVMVISLATAATAALGGIALVRWYGMEGVALAAGASAALHGGLCVLWVRKTLGVWTLPRPSRLRQFALRPAK
jgi:O-antigen/teichoic acid export membrane protein